MHNFLEQAPRSAQSKRSGDVGSGRLGQSCTSLLFWPTCSWRAASDEQTGTYWLRLSLTEADSTPLLAGCLLTGCRSLVLSRWLCCDAAWSAWLSSSSSCTRRLLAPRAMLDRLLWISHHGLTPAIECVNVVLPGCMWHAGQKRERHAGQNLDVAVASA